MDKEIITFGEIEIEKSNFVGVCRYDDIHVSSMFYSGQKSYKYFIC